MELESDVFDLRKQIDNTLGLGARMNLRGLNKNSVSSSKGDEVRDDDDDDEPEVHVFNQKKESWFTWKWQPFKKDIRRIDAKFGSATTSYFLFSRWIYMEFMYLQPLLLTFSGLHIYQMVTLHGYSLIGVITGGIGFLPRFVFFSSYQPGEAVDYTACVVLGILTLLFSSVYKLVKDDKLHKEIVAIEGEDYTSSYAKDVLVAWDNSLETVQEVEDYGGSLGQKYSQKLEDTKYAGIVKEMTTWDYVVLYLRRFLGFFLFIAVQTTAFGIIVYLTVYGENVKTQLEGTPLANFSGALLNITLAAISSVAPEIMKSITDFEEWDSEWSLRIILLRVFLSNTLNVLIVALSYMLLADPNFLYFVPTISRSLFVPVSKQYICRMDQISYELFSLYFNDRIINLVIVFLTGYANYAYAYIFEKNWIKAEVDVQQALLTNITSAGVAMVVFVFCPLSLLFMPMLKAISIYIERYLLIAFYQKPKENWSAQKAEITFTRFYVVNILLLGVPMAVFFLTSKSMPKVCDIQDNFYQLCVSGTIFQEICTLNPESPYYKLKDANSTSINTDLCFNTFDEHYPRCLCGGSLACGPFVREDDAFSPLRAFINYNQYLEGAWTHIISESYIAWPIVFGLVVLIMFKRNTTSVERKTNELKLTELLNQNDYLLWQNHHQDSVINKLKGLS